MKRMFILLLLSATASAQQIKNPVTTVVKEMLSGRQKNIVAAVEEMPADKFSYKPTADQMPFGHLVAHIIESNNLFCAKAGDVAAPKTEEAKETDGKDKLVSSLKASFDFCTTALAKADYSKLGDTIEGFGASADTNNLVPGRGSPWPAVGPTTMAPLPCISASMASCRPRPKRSKSD